MAFINGYFFQTLQAAQQAESLINEGEVVPAFADSVTTTYCSPSHCVSGWYIPFDEVTQKYLGTPVQIQIPEKIL